MKNIIIILLVILIFTFLKKPLENMSVNLKCKKINDNYQCKEEDSFLLIINNINEILNTYKETAQKKYKEFKQSHDEAKRELEQHFGKIKT